MQCWKGKKGDGYDQNAVYEILSEVKLDTFEAVLVQ